MFYQTFYSLALIIYSFNFKTVSYNKDRTLFSWRYTITIKLELCLCFQKYYYLFKSKRWTTIIRRGSIKFQHWHRDAWESIHSTQLEIRQIKINCDSRSTQIAGRQVTRQKRTTNGRDTAKEEEEEPQSKTSQKLQSGDTVGPRALDSVAREVILQRQTKQEEEHDRKGNSRRRFRVSREIIV